MTPVWLRSGKLIDPCSLDLDRITLDDLAFALGHTYRFGGHADPPITVAQHTLACSRQAAKDSPLLGLLALHHDDGEAFFGDMPNPIKVHPEMTWYRAQEYRATLACIKHFAPACLDLSLSAVKVYDQRALVTEARDRLPTDRDEWPLPDVPPLPRAHYYPSDTWETWIGRHQTLTEKAERWLAAEREEKEAEDRELARLNALAEAEDSEGWAG